MFYSNPCTLIYILINRLFCILIDVHGSYWIILIWSLCWDCLFCPLVISCARWLALNNKILEKVICVPHLGVKNLITKTWVLYFVWIWQSWKHGKILYLLQANPWRTTMSRISCQPLLDKGYEEDINLCYSKPLHFWGYYFPQQSSLLSTEILPIF